MNLKDNNLLKLLKTLSLEEKEVLAENIFLSLKEIHQEKLDQDWLDIFTVKLNISRFYHGLEKNQGYRDYILTDYAKEYLHVVKDRNSSRQIVDNSILNTKVNEDLTVSFDISNEYGDKIFDYVDLNYIAYFDKDFANILITKFSNGRHEGRFYRLFTIYTIKSLLDFIVYKESEENISNKKFNDKILDFIIDSFEDFTETKPNWVK